ncbi:MAG: Uma2 family endonuclease [Methylococcus sp.]
MPNLRKLELLSEREYLAGEELSDLRHEYVEGQIFAMTGANERHNRITVNLGYRLRGAARGSRCGVFVSDMRLYIRERRIYYYPDVMLTCDATDDHELYKERPCLVAEVLSASTETTDRREKLNVYRGIPSLCHILLIHANKAEVDYFCRNAAGEWETARLEQDQIIDIRCGDYGTALSLSDLYEDVVFPVGTNL